MRGRTKPNSRNKAQEKPIEIPMWIPRTRNALVMLNNSTEKDKEEERSLHNSHPGMPMQMRKKKVTETHRIPCADGPMDMDKKKITTKETARDLCST